MPIRRFILHVLIAIILAKIFNNSLEIGVIAFLIMLNSSYLASKKEYELNKRIPTKMKTILISISIVGITLIVLGKLILHVDGLIIAGAIFLALSISTFITYKAVYVVGFLKKRIKLK